MQSGHSYSPDLDVTEFDLLKVVLLANCSVGEIFYLSFKCFYM